MTFVVGGVLPSLNKMYLDRIPGCIAITNITQRQYGARECALKFETTVLPGGKH